jgi:hypothetical protein
MASFGRQSSSEPLAFTSSHPVLSRSTKGIVEEDHPEEDPIAIVGGGEAPVVVDEATGLLGIAQNQRRGAREMTRAEMQQKIYPRWHGNQR